MVSVETSSCHKKTNVDSQTSHECAILLTSLNDEFNKLKISQYPNNNMLFKLKRQLSNTVHFLKKINNTNVANTLPYTQNLKNKSKKYQSRCNIIGKWIGYIYELIITLMVVWLIFLLIFNMMTFIVIH